MLTIHLHTKHGIEHQGVESKVSGWAVKGFTLLVQLSYISRHDRGKRKQNGRHYTACLSTNISAFRPGVKLKRENRREHLPPQPKLR